jgi:hypothetical protein
MAFAEDLDVFMDVAGFAVTALLEAAEVKVIFDAPGLDVVNGSVSTTEPSVLVAASEEPQVEDELVLDVGDLPAQLAHHAGTYKVRNLMPEPPDGVFVRCFLVKT